MIGLAFNGKTTNENGQSATDCGNLWQKFEKENFAERIPGKLSEETYAVYYDYEGDHTKPYSYFIGCKVTDDSEIPKGMTSLDITAGNYLKITTSGKMPDCVGNAWKEIWSSNVDRVYKFDFEIYDERSKNWENAEVDIFISV